MDKATSRWLTGPARELRDHMQSGEANSESSAGTCALDGTASSSVDPYNLLKEEMTYIRSSLFTILGSSHSTLSKVASYYFQLPSKQLRPLIILLFSRATNGLSSRFPLQLSASSSLEDMFSDLSFFASDHIADLCSSLKNACPSPPVSVVADSTASPPQLAHMVLPTQLRLAQIVEIIHVASLLHDDVVDQSDLRRGAPSASAAFGNKLAILGGDFLLIRACTALSKLGEMEVTELIAEAIANVVEGEILQMEETDAGSTDGLSSSLRSSVSSLRDLPANVEIPCTKRWNAYLQKTYLKTATLIAKGARAAVVLGGCKDDEIWKEVAYAYGRNLGMAFQLVDDVLDFSSSTVTGKPGSGTDLRLGIATGPVLYAAEEYPELESLIAHGFKHDGDVERALALIHASSGISRTQGLARAYAEKAKEVLGVLPASEAREALEALTDKIIKRTW